MTPDPRDLALDTLRERVEGLPANGEPIVYAKAIIETAIRADEAIRTAVDLYTQEPDREYVLSVLRVLSSVVSIAEHRFNA